MKSPLRASRTALASDLDRIEAARLAAERLCDWLRVDGVWNVYVDSLGGVVSERP